MWRRAPVTRGLLCLDTVSHGAPVPSTVQAGRQTGIFLCRYDEFVISLALVGNTPWQQGARFVMVFLRLFCPRGFQTARQGFAAEAAGLGWPLALCSMRCHHSSHPLQLISGGPYHQSLCVVSTVVSILCSNELHVQNGLSKTLVLGASFAGAGPDALALETKRRDGGQSTDNSATAYLMLGRRGSGYSRLSLFQTGKPYPARPLIGGWQSCGLISKSGLPVT
ncbi:hypothetical protein HDV63DRAFT_360525 [Trichoderma sp. SZMC 28014]